MLHYRLRIDLETAVPPTRYAASIANPFWRPASAWRPAMSADWWQWLASTDSLTARLVAAADGGFSVRLLAQCLDRPRRDEALALGVPSAQRVWRREVALCVAETPWVVARSVAPLARMRGQCLGRLGERSLGSWLFRQADLQRSPIEITRQPPPFYDAHGPWGRRSLFRHGHFMVLVQEFFLARMADELGLPSR